MPFQILPLAAGLGHSAPEIIFHGLGLGLALLHREGGKQLIVIRCAPNVADTPTFGCRDWTRNDADMDGQEIVWARDMGAEHNRGLLDYFKDRRPWLLDVEISGTKLLPYPR